MSQSLLYREEETREIEVNSLRWQSMWVWGLGVNKFLWLSPKLSMLVDEGTEQLMSGDWGEFIVFRYEIKITYK